MRFFLPSLAAICLLALPAARSVPAQEAAPPLVGEEADEAQAKLQQARQWVEQLGNDEYAMREEAADRLREMDIYCVEALEEGCRQLDLEVRFRCERLLTDVYSLERQRRLADFAAGVVRADENELPYWIRFQEVMGNDVASRRLFLEMLRSEWDLLQAVHDSPDMGGWNLEIRCVEIQARLKATHQEVPLGSVATLLFLAPEFQPLPNFVPQEMFSLCFQSSISRAIQQDEFQQSLRRLLGRWVEQGAGAAGSSSPLMLAMKYDLPEGLPHATAMIADETLRAQQKQLAIVAVAQLGDESQISLLEPYMEDRSICQTQQNGDERLVTQLRDVALVAEIYLSNADPKAFGFDRVQRNGYWFFHPASIGFADDESRQEIFQRWRQYKQDHPLEVPATEDESIATRNE